MENFFHIMEDENINKEYSSFCSSCNSVLQSICSVGIPSFFELNDENSVKIQIGKNMNIAQNTGTIYENVNEYTSSNHIKEKAFVKDINNSTINSLITIQSDTHKMQKMIKENNDKIDYYTTKKLKHIEALHKVSTNSSKIISIKRLNSKDSLRDNINFKKTAQIDQDLKENKLYLTLSDVKNKTSILMEPNLNNILNYEILETKILNTTKGKALIKSQNKNNCIAKDILNQRKKILETIKSILHLCNCMDIMREMILQEAHKQP